MGREINDASAKTKENKGKAVSNLLVSIFSIYVVLVPAPLFSFRPAVLLTLIIRNTNEKHGRNAPKYVNTQKNYFVEDY